MPSNKNPASIAMQMRKARKVLSKAVVTLRRVFQLPRIARNEVFLGIGGWPYDIRIDAYRNPWGANNIVLAKSYEHLAASFPAETKVDN
jgi:hypothetical protein